KLLEGHLHNLISRVAEIKIKKQVRRLVLRYHRLDRTHDKINVIHALAAMGETAQDALMKIRAQVLLYARHGSDTDVELLRCLDYRLINFPSVFLEVLQDMLDGADHDQLAKTAAALLDINDERIIGQMVGLLDSDN